MKIRTAFILCAGFGKRLSSITEKIPKPLIKVKNVCLLENTIKLVQDLKIERIKINTFYLGEQINEFIDKLKLPIQIEIINDGKEILNTGGGLLNLLNKSEGEDFLVLNPDTLWNFNDLKNIKNMEHFYFDNKIKNVLMVVNKEKSFDKRFNGDFDLQNNILINSSNKKFIYTGCQIINKNLFNKVNKKVFSIFEIWNDLIEKKQLFGFESDNDFYHITDFKIYKELNS